uniref:Uncharacterized protein n=1 Tax=Davidia involucrata TaxID=16924 RepID=A0A5B7C2A7_DAVIN
MAGLRVSPDSPSGSDVSDSSPMMPPMKVNARQIESTPIWKPDNDPPTALTLSLPGTDSDSYVIQNHDSAQETPSSHRRNQSSEFGTPVVGKHHTMTFSPEFLSVMQEMIRKEVRNYMSGSEKCLPSEAGVRRNVVGVKRMGISKID